MRSVPQFAQHFGTSPDRLDVPYGVGGSVASSFAGVARATLDVDLVANVHREHAEPLTDALMLAYYINVDMIREAIGCRGTFHVIHLATMCKIDVFVMEETAFARESMARRVARELPDLGRALYCMSPEDIVLHTLLRYAMGGGVSDQDFQKDRSNLNTEIAGFDRFIGPEFLGAGRVDDLAFADDVDIIDESQGEGDVLLHQ